ncbi:MAG TPA: pyruvate carboxylase subunit B [Candidatus Avidehalobacter gallistercoris]|uniref:Pyruvate carboxylase subunit B n=1 Tax=Candidatus Avidehalobacter gallistercoris TaxID=2840694 RepID=A0A9D1HKS1_9FIRM|nr:pyruvate carboxylase subunit B [Candidatus Avidehalobacter gallistercoris]
MAGFFKKLLGENSAPAPAAAPAAKPQTAAKHKVGITDTTLRDAHQSLLATRMALEDILSVASDLDKVGFHSMEVWGGATFDSCMRFLNEDPWERLRKIRKACPNTKLQMLLRGQNLLGYRHYSDDVVDLFVKKCIENGIDIIRIFDALNDVRNVESAVKATKKYGGHAQVAVSYTNSPVHNTAHFVDIAKKLKAMGADSICIKDMSGLIYPYVAYELVKGIKEQVGLTVQLHCHYTTGMAAMSYMKAIEAGCDVVDCAMSPLAMGTSQPADEVMVAVLKGTPYDTGINIDKLLAIAPKVKEIRTHYKEYDISNPGVDPTVLASQIPGGMMSNFLSQLKAANALDRLDEVMAEVPRVRKDMGYPPLVTPSSQIVGSQALMNVLSGGRYKMVTNEVKAYFQGHYGQPPAPMDEKIKKQIIGDLPSITHRPADDLPPYLEDAKKEIGDLAKNDEDLLLYIMFPQVAKPFLEQKYNK